MDLRKIRGERRQREVAEELGCSIASICRAEKGYRISPLLKRAIEMWAMQQGKHVTWRGRNVA